MKKKQQDQGAEVSIMEVTKGRLLVRVVGDTPIILNSMSAKAQQQILAPCKKTAVEKQSSMKHNPVEEFRASAHQLEDGPVALAIQAAAFKRALSSAALDMPGAKKSQIGRLTYVEGDYVGIYGVPKLLMSVVRCADIARTPDIRSRVIIPEWCAEFSLTFVTPLLRQKPVIDLLAAAGIYIGVGDWRPEKGAGNFGQFRLVAKDDRDFARIVKAGGRRAQLAALKDPICHNSETSELLSWYDGEKKRRGFDKKHEASVAAKAKHGRVNGTAVDTSEVTTEATA